MPDTPLKDALRPVTRLILTTEVSGVSASGGIASYVDEVLKLRAPGTVAVLHIGRDGLARTGFPVLSDAAVDADTKTVDDLTLRALMAVQTLLPLLPSLKVVESQDYFGLLCRIAQAREAGLIDIPCLQITCHGGHHYVDRANETWSGQHLSPTMWAEKTAIELADTVVYPTRYLRSLYAETGLSSSGRAVVARIPFSPPAAPDVRVAAKPRRLCFLGRRTAMKGFDLFVDAVHEAHSANPGAISAVTVMAPKPGWLEPLRWWRPRFPAGIKVTYASLPRHELLPWIAKAAIDTVFVLPYRADNHPYAVLEAACSGAALITVCAGGIPEIVPAVAAGVLSRPTAADLARAIGDTLTLTPEKFAELRASTMRTFRAAQPRIAADYGRLLDEIELVSRPPRDQQPESVSVVIPVFNTPANQLQAAIDSVLRQGQPPEEIVIVDDGSCQNTADEIDRIARTPNPSVALKVIRIKNAGLPAARNAGVAACVGRRLFFLDSDDILHEDAIGDLAKALASGDIAVPYNSMFHDGDKPESRPFTRAGYRPIGGDLGQSLIQNCLGSSAFMCSRKAFDEISGFDGSTRAQWEDWQFHLKAKGAGFKHVYVPKHLYFYRVRTDSMLRTFPVFPGMVRIAASGGYPTTRYDLYRLSAVLRAADGQSFAWRMQFVHIDGFAKMVRILLRAVALARTVATMTSRRRSFATKAYYFAARFTGRAS